MLPDAALVVAAVGLVVIHRRGLTRDTRDTVLPMGGWGFPVGSAVVLLAVSPLVESAAERSFVWHMAQHQLLVLLAAPLLATSAPLRRLWLGATGRRLPGAGPLGGAAAWPLPAGVLAVGVLLAWHLPALYDTAMVQPAVHLLEHATLLGSASLLWACILHAARDDRRLGGAVVALAGTAIAGAALGVVLLTAPRPLYDAYVAGGAIALDQQRIGGALMKIGALLVHAGAAVAITLRWLHRLADSPATASSR